MLGCQHDQQEAPHQRQACSHAIVRCTDKCGTHQEGEGVAGQLRHPRLHLVQPGIGKCNQSFNVCTQALGHAATALETQQTEVKPVETCNQHGKSVQAWHTRCQLGVYA